MLAKITTVMTTMMRADRAKNAEALLLISQSSSILLQINDPGHTVSSFLAGYLHPFALFAKGWDFRVISAIRFAAMTDAANLDGIGIAADEEEAVVANTQSKLFSSL